MKYFWDFLKLKIRQTMQLDRTLLLIWQSGPKWTIARVTLLVILGVLPLLPLYLMKLVVDVVAESLANPDGGNVFEQVALLIALTGAVSLVTAVFQSLAALVNETQAQVVTNHMYGILHGKALEVDLAYYENPQYYDTLHRAQQEAPHRPTRILNDLAQVAQNLISLLAIVGLLISFHWGVAVILFVASVPDIIVRLKFSKRLYRWERRRTVLGRKAWYFDWILTRDTHAKEIRLFDLGALFRHRFGDLRQQLLEERLKIATRRSLATLGAQAIVTVAVFGSYAFIAYRTMQGAITLGDLVMYYQAFRRGQEFLGRMLGGLAGLYEDNLFLSNFYEFLDLKPTIVESVQPRSIPRPIQCSLVFDNVSFQYPTGTRKVLEDINLTIRPGEHVALVGENGSGKTTLVKLLSRLYEPTGGSIMLDGVDIRDFKIADLRREISIIFQDYVHYHLTARENIWFGNIKLPPDQEQIIIAAQKSGADKIIRSLPQGYDTILGKWFEDGEELSIGEWQKVALARAFLRKAQIIVLDEPTSAMDAKAEYEVFKKFYQLAANQTAIIISHRLSTVKMADCIYVLDDGKIVERGTHEELMGCQGTYAHLFETQAQYYR